jgi:hypothetical protein
MTAQALSEPVHEEQRHPGRTSPCCAGMKWALSCGYVVRGFFWRKVDPPVWMPWCVRIRGIGFYDTSPIRYCPWCGLDLDVSEEA